MHEDFGTLGETRRALAEGRTTPTQLAEEALARANGNAGQNTYLWRNAEWTRAEAARAEAMPRAEGGAFGDGRPGLWGLPVSVKDCFDLAGAPTSCGVEFYRNFHGTAERDSWLVERLRAAGAVITGKTHLHPLAYGITGENPEFGDCRIPGKPDALTGGSSSGAAASVVEGSAMAAIGTDTGGSVRAPAALCGLAGYRATIGRGDWRGAGHLAPPFDTVGWLFRDLRDAPLLAAPFAPEGATARRPLMRFAAVDERFLEDCEPEVLTSFRNAVEELAALGLSRAAVDVEWWRGAFEVFAPIQAWEAVRIHAGHFEHFEDAIRERLEWGARISDEEIAGLRWRHAEFRARMDALFAEHEALVLPATPTARLAAGADHSQTRGRMLRYTAPFSLAGVPVVTVPCPAGGIQLAAARGRDEDLLALAARMGTRRMLTNS